MAISLANTTLLSRTSLFLSRNSRSLAFCIPFSTSSSSAASSSLPSNKLHRNKWRSPVASMLELGGVKIGQEVGSPCEAVDPELEANFQEVEASQLLQIGLLCVQASAELRPSMPVVVKMLTHSQDIPQPTQPPFLNSSIREANQTSGNSMTESLIDPR